MTYKWYEFLKRASFLNSFTLTNKGRPDWVALHNILLSALIAGGYNPEELKRMKRGRGKGKFSILLSSYYQELTPLGTGW